MTIEKNIWADVQDGVTQGLAAAELVNDNKRAVNEVIDVVNGLGTASTMTNASGGDTLGTAAPRNAATTAQAIAGEAGVLPDAAGVHSVIRGLAVGTVSQSGGVPTGAIIQRGSNANGEFVRYADGTQICTRNVGDTGTNIISTLVQSEWYVSILPHTSAAPFAGQYVRLAMSDTRLGSDIREAHWTLTNNTFRCCTLSEHNRHVRVEILEIGRWY